MEVRVRLAHKTYGTGNHETLTQAENSFALLE
jgi:hypothetical protein